MGKRGAKNHTKGNKKPKSSKNHVYEEDMDDEIDAFHKQRDLVPLNVNEASEDSDDDEEVPVFDFENEYEESDEDEDEVRDTGLAAKIARQQKYLKEKYGGSENAMEDEEEEEDEKQNAAWSGSKHQYYDADNADYELQSSGDESPAEEEEEVIRLHKEKAKSMSMADFGAEDTSEDESDRELTLEEMSVEGKCTKKSSLASDMGSTYEEVKKDLSTLSREEQLDVLYSSAPELVGLLSELDQAVEELESTVDPLLNKVKNEEIKLEGGIRYLELKKLLLLSYSQAIAFYLLLKSEGHPVRDHPVLARLVEIKGLLDKTKELDGYIPTELEEILNRSNAVNLGKDSVTSVPDSSKIDHVPSRVSTETPAAVVHNNDADVGKLEILKENGKKSEKRKRQDDQVGVESMKMLKLRAALEEKLKQKGVFASGAPKVDKTQKIGKPLNRRLETYDDFDDDTSNAVSTRGLINGHKSSLSASKLSQLIGANPNKPKAVSGDDDLPQRDDVGERRRKHELQVLARAGIVPDDEEADMDEDSENEEADMDEDSGSEDELYKQVKQQRAAKMATKAELYSRNPALPSLPETVDGKRLITYQMEKNRGLTRQRKKLIKNPRKKYKLKHEKAVKRRQGQVREVKKPVAPYGGEASGINTRISRSIRF